MAGGQKPASEGAIQILILALAEQTNLESVLQNRSGSWKDCSSQVPQRQTEDSCLWWIKYISRQERQIQFTRDGFRHITHYKTAHGDAGNYRRNAAAQICIPGCHWLLEDVHTRVWGKDLALFVSNKISALVRGFSRENRYRPILWSTPCLPHIFTCHRIYCNSPAPRGWNKHLFSNSASISKSPLVPFMFHYAPGFFSWCLFLVVYTELDSLKFTSS